MQVNQTENLIVPYTLDCNDMKFFPRLMAVIMCEESLPVFERQLLIALYEEGATTQRK